jgi:protein associated with RNAse G/E
LVNIEGDDLMNDKLEPNHQTSWNKVKGAISSIVYEEENQKEEWFNKTEHIHDSGSNYDYWNEPRLLLQWPGLGYNDTYIYKDTKVRNLLVNEYNVTAKERGISMIVIDASKIKETVTLQFISEQWIFTFYW